VTFLSGALIIYIISPIYIDWMHGMGQRRQLLWAILHAPLHFTLLLVMEGITQLIIWWRVVEVVNETTGNMMRAMKPTPSTSGTVSAAGKEIAHSASYRHGSRSPH